MEAAEEATAGEAVTLGEGLGAGLGVLSSVEAVALGVAISAGSGAASRALTTAAARIAAELTVEVVMAAATTATAASAHPRRWPSGSATPMPTEAGSIVCPSRDPKYLPAHFSPGREAMLDGMQERLDRGP